MGKKRAMMIGLDGADPLIIKELIGKGKLPNFRKFIEQGVAHESYGMLGVNPTVTPPNWCSLATGNWPRTHGITCFFGHTLGNPLDMIELHWDSRRVQSEFIWESFERVGKKSVLLQYCEAWPPRVEGTKNIFIDGTGATPFLRDFCDFQKVITLDSEAAQIKYVPHYMDTSDVGDCIVYSDQLEAMAESQVNAPKDVTFAGGDLTKRSGSTIVEHTYPELTNTPKPLNLTANVVLDTEKDPGGEGKSLKPAADFITSPLREPKNWVNAPEGAKEGTFVVNNGLERRYVLLVASDGKTYDTISVYSKKDTATFLGEAKVNEWSDFIYDHYNLKDTPTKVAYRIRVLNIDPEGKQAQFFMAQALDLTDDNYYYPTSLHNEFMEHVGPVCSMASYGRYEAQSDRITMESFDQIYDWHIKATDYLLKEQSPDWDLFYMHIHGIDSVNHWYINQAIPGAHPEWERIRGLIDEIYEITDKYLGCLMEYMDGDTAIFLTSDHAAVPRQPGYENPGIGELGGITASVMSQLGYTNVYRDEKSGKWKVDWTTSRAIPQRSSHVYVNLKGRDPQGIVEPEDYEKTVQQIISDLYNYRDPVSGDRVIAFCMTREEMEAIGMGGPHCGDIFFQTTNNFGHEHANCLNHVTNEGFSLLCLCLMAGGGLKKGEIIQRPVRLVDVVPTICHICDAPMPRNVEGGIIYQALEGFVE